MFKEIIATTLMCTAFGTPKLMFNNIETKVNDTPSLTYRTDNYSEWTNTLSGTYTLNESINYDSLRKVGIYSGGPSVAELTISLESDSVENEYISFASAYFKDNGSDNMYVSGINSLYLYINIYFNTYSISYLFYDYYGHGYDGITNAYNTLDEYDVYNFVGVYGSEYSSYLLNGDIYFNKDITLTDVEKGLFFAYYHKVYFTSENNCTFTGMYVLKDTTINYDDISLGVYNATSSDYIDWQSLGTSFIFTYNIFPSEFIDCKLSYYGNSYYSDSISDVDYLFFNATSCMFNFYTGSGNFMYTFDLTDTSSDFGYNFTSLDTNLSKKLCLYISDSVYLTGFWRDVINTFFSKAPNRYWTSYTGWYTFNQYLSNYNGGVFGSLMVNNTLYNSLKWTNNSVGVGLLTLASYKLNNEYLAEDVYSDGAWSLESRRVYLSGVLMPIEIYNQMLGNGTFAFVPSAEQSDLKSLIFAIVDSPIKMLTDLMDVELLGTNFFVAFMGIVSVVLICFIVRKIV